MHGTAFVHLRVNSAQAALELTRRWHQVCHSPLPAVSGDDALAFATAFYSPDHPRYRRPFALQWPIPLQHVFENGWAASALAMTRFAVSGPGTYAQPRRMPSALTSSWLIAYGSARRDCQDVAMMVLPREGKAGASAMPLHDGVGGLQRPTLADSN